MKSDLISLIDLKMSKLIEKLRNTNQIKTINENKKYEYKEINVKNSQIQLSNYNNEIK